MRLFSPQFAYFLRQHNSRRSIALLVRLILFMVFLAACYSSVFMLLMHHENRPYHWVDSIYWTITTMSTVGYGDITFNSPMGKIFSIAVASSGILVLFLLLPVFVQFFYAPWIEAQASSRVPREIPITLRGHVIIAHRDPVTLNLIKKIEQAGMRYVLIISDLNEALRIYDQGTKVVLGSLDDQETCRKVHAENAAMVVTTDTDPMNTHVAFAVREVSPSVPVVATANTHDAVTILKLAGCSHVLQIHEMLGQFLARRVRAGGKTAHVIGAFDQIFIVEAVIAGTVLEGKKLVESGLREKVGANVLGLWSRGSFEPVTAQTTLTNQSVMLMSCTQEQLNLFNATYPAPAPSGMPVLIIGGSRVGKVAARTLHEAGIDYRIIDKDAETTQPDKFILGDAADAKVLQQAGMEQAHSIIITTHDDQTNIYLTILYRHLRPDIQIISRCTLERNLTTMHRAGADYVMSYASMGANAIFNVLKKNNVFLMAEGLDIFTVNTPAELCGKTLVESAILQNTGCNVIAIRNADRTESNPSPSRVLTDSDELILIGGLDAEESFYEKFKKA